MDCSRPGFPVLHHLPELVEIHVHWVGDAIWSSVIPYSSCLQSFAASGSFPMSQFFASGGQSIGNSAFALVLPMNIQGWFPLGLTDLILLSKGLSRFFSNITVQKHKFLGTQPPSVWMVQLSQAYMTTRKTIALTRWTFVSKVTSLLFFFLSRFVIAFLPRNKHLLFSIFNKQVLLATNEFLWRRSF